MEVGGVSGIPLTASAAGTRTEVAGAEPAASRRAWVTSGVIVVATIVALALRLYELSRPGYLTGISEYDDGTDFGSAIRLAHGALPYRDFIMVQPPGITLLMAPVALATKGAGTIAGMAAARVVTALASTAAVPLAGLLTRHRGLVAVLVSCGVLTVFPDSLMAARTVLLEPWLVLFCLLGAIAVFDRDQLAGPRRLVIGGLAFGFAGAVKVWAILPVAVILVLAARRPRRALAFAGGVAAGFAVPVLPFALTAPGTFYRAVVVAQLVRSDLQRVPAGFRLQHMLGLTHLSQLPTPLLSIIGIAVAAAIAAVMVAGSRRLASRPPPLDMFAALGCVVVVIAFLWPADFYYHYAAFLAPFLGLAIGLSVSRLLAAGAAGEAAGAVVGGGRTRASGEVRAALDGAVVGGGGARAGAEVRSAGGAAPDGAVVGGGGARAGAEVTSAGGVASDDPGGGGRASRGGRRLRALARRSVLAVTAVTVVVLASLQAAAEGNMASAIPATEISYAQKAVPPGSCVVTDQVSYTIAINRFVSTRPGCPLMVDGVGADYTLSRGHNGLTGAGRTAAVEQMWMSAFRAAQYLWLTSEADRRIPWTPQLLAYFHAHFVPLTVGPDWLYVRRR
jgi:glycosyl transferase family 87